MHEATGLPKMKTFWWCNPYVVVQFAGQSQRSSIKKNTKTANWNERFEFQANEDHVRAAMVANAANQPFYQGTDPSKDVVELQMFSWDNGNSDQFVGSVGIYLARDNTECHSYQILDDKGQDRGTVVLSWSYQAPFLDSQDTASPMLNQQQPIDAASNPHLTGGEGEDVEQQNAALRQQLAETQQQLAEAQQQLAEAARERALLQQQVASQVAQGNGGDEVLVLTSSVQNLNQKLGYSTLAQVYQLYRFACNGFLTLVSNNAGTENGLKHVEAVQYSQSIASFSALEPESSPSKVREVCMFMSAC